MPALATFPVRHLFGGGWATDFGPTVDVAPDQSGKVVIPFLVDAEDCFYELDGGPHKIGGAAKVNSAEIESGAVITGLYDYWRHGTAGSPARRRVIHAGTKILADSDDGTFNNELFTGLELGKVPCYFTFDDLLIISSDSTVDVPKSWDQTTAQNLAGSPPRFSFGVAHKNRAWAAGNYLAPSRLYYSANTDPEDWTGAGSGSIDIDPNDGDMITGLASHKDELIVFKGPNKGSIHRITGSSPTGSDAFARKNYVKGLGAAWQNAIFPFGDDLGFVSQFGSVHNLSATAAYGDFFEAALSRPINVGEIKTYLNYGRLRHIWAATDPLSGLTLITASWDSSATNNRCLLMDFRSAPEIIRWAKIKAYQAASIGLFVDTNGVRRILAGGNDGFVRRLNIADRSIDGTTGPAFRITTPHMNYGDPLTMKTLEQGSVGIAPKGNHNFTFGWQRDGNAQQTMTLSQAGGDVLGPASANQFTLDTSALGGSQFVDVFHEFNEDGGEFRSVQFQVADAGNNQDIEVHSITALVHRDAVSTENG
jgi:hypothetical protein